MGQTRPLFGSFFTHIARTNVAKFGYINDKSVLGVLGSRTQAAGSLAQTNPLSYGDTLNHDESCIFLFHLLNKASVDNLRPFLKTMSV